MPTVDHAEHLMREGAFQQAKDLLAQIISEDPEDLRAICNIGIAYTETGENGKAIKALMHYIRNDEGNPCAWEALGCAHFRTGSLTEARRCLVRSLDLSPENPSALRNLGIINGMEGRREDGLELLEHSAVLAPDEYRTLYALSYAYKDSGDTEKRMKVLASLSRMDLPDDVYHDILLTQIRLNLGWE